MVNNKFYDNCPKNLVINQISIYDNVKVYLFMI